MASEHLVNASSMPSSKLFIKMFKDIKDRQSIIYSFPVQPPRNILNVFGPSGVTLEDFEHMFMKNWYPLGVKG